MAKQRNDEAKEILQRYAKSKKEELTEEDWDKIVRTETRKFEVGVGSWFNLMNMFSAIQQKQCDCRNQLRQSDSLYSIYFARH